MHQEFTDGIECPCCWKYADTLLIQWNIQVMVSKEKDDFSNQSLMSEFTRWKNVWKPFRCVCVYVHIYIYELPEKAGGNHMARQTPPSQRSSWELICQAFMCYWGECKSGRQITLFKSLMCDSPMGLFYNELEEGKHTQSGQKKCFKDALKVSLKSFEINSQHIQNASTRLVYDKAAPTEVPSLVNRWGSQGHKGKEMCKPWANFLLSVPGGCQCLTCSRSFSAYIRLIDHSWTHCTPSFFPVLPSVIVNTDRLTNNNNTFY